MKLPFFLASRFVAGETLDESLPVVDALNRDGLHVALDKLGEHVHEREEALATRDAYIDLVRTLAGRDGTEWFPYFSRRLREKKENVWFVLKNLLFRK